MPRQMEADMKHRVPLFIGVAVVVMLIGPALPAHAQQKLIGGVSGAGFVDCALNASMHSTVVRTGIPWYQLQPTNAPIDYGYQDDVFRCYIQNGMRVYYTLAYAPDWAGGHGDCGGGDPQCHMPDLNAWYSFVYDVINHYTQIGLADQMVFGIWNEADGRFLTGCSDKVACWGSLWQHAAAARNSANPSARLAGPEMGRIDGALDQALGYMASGIQPQDIVSTHWYPGSSAWIEYWVNTTKQKAGGRETWVTESGVNDCNDGTQANSLEWIMRSFAWWQSAAGAYIYYQVVPGDAEACFDVHNRPSFDVLKRWADFLTPPGEALTLASGQALFAGDAVTSPNGVYTLIYQTDGNLVIYVTGGPPVWSSDTSGTCTGLAYMQPDGNFVIYDCMSQPIWSTGTSGNSGAYLGLLDDGNLYIYAADGRGLWSRQ